MTIRPIASLLLLSLLTACGGAGPTAPDRSSNKQIISLPGNGSLGELARNHLGGSTLDDGRGGDMLVRARTMLQDAPSFGCTLIARTFGRYRKGEDTGVARETRVVYELAWGRPNRIVARVVESNEGDMDGVRVASTEAGALRIKAPGLFGFLTRKVSAEDPRLKNARGHTLADVRPDAHFARLSGPQAVWTVIGAGETQFVQPTVRIGVANVPRLDREIDREEIELTTDTLAMAQYVAYVGMRRVVAYEFTDFRWNTPVPDDFDI